MRRLKHEIKKLIASITLEAWRRLRQECLRIELETCEACTIGDVVSKLAMTLPPVNANFKSENPRPQPKNALRQVAT